MKHKCKNPKCKFKGEEKDYTYFSGDGGEYYQCPECFAEYDTNWNKLD